MNVATEREEYQEKLFNFRPLFFAAVFLCFGIYFAYAYRFDGLSMWWAIIVVACAVCPIAFAWNRKSFIKRCGAGILLLLAFIIGFFSFCGQIAKFTDCRAYDGVAILTGRVVERTENAQTVKLVLTDLHIGENREEGSLVAYLPASFCENVSLSDELLLRGYVKSNTELFNDYGFRANDIGENIRFTLSNPSSCEKTGHTFDLFLWMRDSMEESVRSGMEETSASVTIAVLTGNTSGIGDGLLENIRYGGIAHIFAVSGLHVGALYAFCLWLFSKTKMKKLSKPFRFVGVASVLLFYAGVCGFSPSIIRAVVLCLTTYFTTLLGTKFDGLQAMGMAAILILLGSPASLFEIGFQLSFLACIGIFLFAKPIGYVCDEITFRIREFFPKTLTREAREALLSGDTLPPSLGERIRRNAVSLFSVSLATQLATAPVLLRSFGYLSGWSTLLNFIFVPLIGLVFSALLLFVFLATILPISVSGIILYFPSVVWSAALLVFETVDFSTFAITGMQLSGGSCVCYYSGLTFLSDKWNIPKPLRAVLAIGCFLAFVCSVAVGNV